MQYYAEYLTISNPITPKQTTLLHTMINSSTQNIPDFLSHFDLVNIQHAQQKNMHAYLKWILDHTLITKDQIEQLQKYSTEYISKIINRSITNLETMNINEYKFFNKRANPLHQINKFKHKYLDKPYLSSPEYELGWQPYDDQWSIHYIKFYDLCMIDYDNIDIDEINTNLTRFIKQYPNFVFRIYKTTAGYHAFIISHILPHSDLDVPTNTIHPTIKIMRDLQCDPYYILFASKNGFKVRLNHKNRPNDIIGDYIHTIGDPTYIQPDQLHLCHIYEQLQSDD